MPGVNYVGARLPNCRRAAIAVIGGEERVAEIMEQAIKSGQLVP